MHLPRSWRSKFPTATTLNSLQGGSRASSKQVVQGTFKTHTGSLVTVIRTCQQTPSHASQELRIAQRKLSLQGQCCLQAMCFLKCPGPGPGPQPSLTALLHDLAHRGCSAPAAVPTHQAAAGDWFQPVEQHQDAWQVMLNNRCCMPGSGQAPQTSRLPLCTRWEPAAGLWDSSSRRSTTQSFDTHAYDARHCIASRRRMAAPEDSSALICICKCMSFLLQ